MRFLGILTTLFLYSSTFAQSTTFSDDARFFLVGDSFTNDGNADWAGKVDSLPIFKMDYFSAGGRTLGGMVPVFTDNYQPQIYDAVVIAGGVNDLTAYNRSATEMQAFVASMMGVTNGEHIILTTIAPFRGSSSRWSQARQDTADEFDAWVTELAANSSNISVFDVSQLLDSNDDQIIDAQYASSDNFHPKNCAFGEECGMSYLADSFISQFSAIAVPEPNSMVLWGVLSMASLCARQRSATC